MKVRSCPLERVDRLLEAVGGDVRLDGYLHIVGSIVELLNRVRRDAKVLQYSRGHDTDDAFPGMGFGKHLACASALLEDSLGIGRDGGQVNGPIVILLYGVPRNVKQNT